MSRLFEMVIEDALAEHKVEIAKNALNKGLSVEIIKDITGLDEIEIENLKLEISFN